MLLRRFKTHFAEQNWTAIGVELVIVVIGVFMGLQVQNWNEARIERNAADNYHSRLTGELHRNENNLTARREYYLQIREFAEAALNALHVPASGLEKQFLVDAYMATNRWQLEIDRGVYDEVINAGLMSEISDAEGRMRLTNYYVVFESIRDNLIDDSAYRTLVREFLPVQLQRIIETECGDSIVTNSQGAISISLPSCMPLWDKATTLAAVDLLLSAPGLVTSLNRRVSDLDNQLKILQRNIDRTRDLVSYFENNGLEQGTD